MYVYLNARIDRWIHLMIYVYMNARIDIDRWIYPISMYVANKEILIFVNLKVPRYIKRELRNTN